MEKNANKSYRGGSGLPIIKKKIMEKDFRIYKELSAAAPSTNIRAAVVDVEPLQAVEILDTLDVAPVAPVHPIL